MGEEEIMPQAENAVGQPMSTSNVLNTTVGPCESGVPEIEIISTEGYPSTPEPLIGSYGANLVGLDFNPSNNIDVTRIKEFYAYIINILNDIRSKSPVQLTNEQARHLSIAITEAQTAQMWAVKAITYNK